jgi:hypothetical protein
MTRPCLFAPSVGCCIPVQFGFVKPLTVCIREHQSREKGRILRGKPEP